MRASAALLGRRKFHLQRRQRRRGERLAVAPHAPVHAPGGDGGGLVDMASVHDPIPFRPRPEFTFTDVLLERLFRDAPGGDVSAGDSGSGERPGHEPGPDTSADPQPDLGSPTGSGGDGVRPRIGDREHLYDADDQPAVPDPTPDMPDDPWVRVRMARIDIFRDPPRDAWGREELTNV